LKFRFHRYPTADFPAMIEEILASGETMAELARTLNVPFNTLKAWRSGSNPRWEHGERLRELHEAFQLELRNVATHNL
jgi:transposase-like protein